jgi:hypothetical protein
MGAAEVEAFLSHRAVVRNVSASTRNQAETMVPENLVLPLRDQLARAKRLHDSDFESGYGAVSLPTAIFTLIGG